MLGRKEKFFIPKHLYDIEKTQIQKINDTRKILAMLHLLINKNKEKEEKDTLISQFKSFFLVIDQDKISLYEISSRTARVSLRLIALKRWTASPSVRDEIKISDACRKAITDFSCDPQLTGLMRER